jgi:hypothetical protein
VSELLQAIRQARDILAARRPLPQTTSPQDGLGKYWSADDVGQYRHFKAGGPLPTSPGALEILQTCIELQAKI